MSSFVNFSLQVCLDITGAMNLYLHLSIVIGTVPLRAPPYTPFDVLAVGSSGVEMDYSPMYSEHPSVEEGMFLPSEEDKNTML